MKQSQPLKQSQPRPAISTAAYVDATHVDATQVGQISDLSDTTAFAEQHLLLPNGLSQKETQRRLAQLKNKSADYADFYFQYARAESWGLEEGIVKTGSFSIDQGVGVRVNAGEKTAFSYSDDISMGSLHEACEMVSSISKGHVRHRLQRNFSNRQKQKERLYMAGDPLNSLTAVEKVAFCSVLKNMPVTRMSGLVK